MNIRARQLIVLRGDNKLMINQLNAVSNTILGDWVTVSDDLLLTKHMPQYYPNKQTKLLLGREFKHAIFDARCGFNLDALAILAGTLVAGSLLILLLPEDFSHWHDDDSLRWSELPHAQQVPNFVTHLNLVMDKQQQYYGRHFLSLFITTEWNEGTLFTLISQHNLLSENDAILNSYQSQQQLLDKMINTDARIILITAKRGRGKSALAGCFAREHDCWVCGPNKNAIKTLMKFAPPETQFFAPDEIILHLIQQRDKPDWLIIDEAAMLPLPITNTLIDNFKYILLTSTTDGYEGTGQGLLLKLISQYPSTQVVHFQLHTPIRWAEDDPLEYFIDNLIVANLPESTSKRLNTKCQILQLEQSELCQETILADFFYLLKEAHYRTTLIDLRRLLDAPNLLLYQAKSDEYNIVGVLVAIKEGGLDPQLVEQILKGYRRPKGNLVAQSLVAHGGEPNAAILNSIRVNRIAVAKAIRRRGVATQLINHLIGQATKQGRDFISASFAYSIEMCQFWLQCGFHIVHVGTHKEASSGSYAIMVIYPITLAGQNLLNVMQQNIARNWYWLRRLINIDLPIDVNQEQQLNTHDKLELTLFATTSYSYSASIAVLYRLINWLNNHASDTLDQLPLLHFLTKNQFSDKLAICYFKLSGKRELLKLLRQEIALFIRNQGFINE